MKKVVVVDDDRSILDVTKIILESEGYAVETHTTGKYIKNLCKDRQDRELPSLVILDMLLSGEDGRELCKILKKNPSTKKIPVVLFSAHSQGDIASELKDVGHDYFLPKPFDIATLSSVVEKLLSLNQTSYATCKA